MPAPAKDFADVLLRLLRNVSLSTTGCWEWEGAKSVKGYEEP